MDKLLAAECSTRQHDFFAILNLASQNNMHANAMGYYLLMSYLQYTLALQFLIALQF